MIRASKSSTETKREMTEFIAMFAFEFRERFGDDFKITVKPVRKRWRRRGKKQKRSMLSDGTLWEAETALYFRDFCLPDCTVVWVTADYERSNRTLS